jgi:asparagine synthase (glutamine-hydrolysing)
MSGIGAYLRLGGRLVRPPDVQSLRAGLLPWGQDGIAVWADPDGALGMCHALSVLTPEDAYERQPLESDDGRLVVATNARLDNRADLAAHLGIPPGRAASLPDGALVLAAYRRWGADCVTRLLGAFRILVWDRRDRRLWGAVDHLGEYPMYVHLGDSQVVVASSVPAVLACPGVARRADLGALAAHLVDVPDPTRTGVVGVEQLSGGRTISVGMDGSVRHRRYWRPPESPERTLPFGSADEAAAAFLDVFRPAVSARLRSVAPVGVLCSGGLDSTAVAAVAATEPRRAGGRLTAFTSVPAPEWAGPPRPGWETSDEPYVRALARRHENLDPVFLASDGSVFLDHLDAVHASTGGPFRNVFNLPWVQAAHDAAARRGIRVLLTGAAGNATLSWAGSSLLSELARRGRLPALRREISARSKLTQLPPSSLYRQTVTSFAPRPLLLRRDLRRLGGRPPWAERAALNPRLAAATLDRLALVEAYRPPPNPATHRLAMLAGFGAAPRLQDGTAAIHGVVHRDPTADVRVVEFCLALPTSVFAGGGWQRQLARRAMVELVPPEIRLRTTRGEQAPDAYRHLTARRSDLADAVQVLAGHPTASEILDIPRMRAMLENWPTFSSAAHLQLFVLARAIAAGLFVLWVESP